MYVPPWTQQLVIGEDSALEHIIRVSHVYPNYPHSIVHTYTYTHITHIHRLVCNLELQSCTQNHIHASWIGYYLCLPA